MTENDVAKLVAGVIAVALVLVIVGIFELPAVKGHFGPTLVIQSCRVSKTEEDGAYVILQGRPEGIIALMLYCLGLGKVVRFEISKTSVSKRTIGLTRRLTQAIPCQNVASTEYGFSRSLFLLFLTFAFLVLLVGSLLVPILAHRFGPVAVADPADVEREMNLPWETEWYKIIPIACSAATLVFFLFFWLSKRLVLEIESSGGKSLGIRFRPGIIEGVPLTVKTAEEIVGTINSLAEIR